MILMLRGTSGSGKSCIVYRVMEALGEPNKPFPFGPRGKTGGYVWYDRLTVVGRYETTCGGCDGFNWPGAADDIESKVMDCTHRTPHVLLEGLMISSWGGDRLRRLGGELTIIHLTTSLEDCLASIEDRRKARGERLGKDLGPVNPANTTKKYLGLLTSSDKHEREGLRIERLNRADALARTFELLGIAV